MTSQQPAAPATAGPAERSGPQPIISDRRGVAAPHIAVCAFSAIPLVAVALAIPRSPGAGAWAGPT